MQFFIPLAIALVHMCTYMCALSDPGASLSNCNSDYLPELLRWN